MKNIWIIISKVALFLVIFGFFQPVACDMKGFDLAKYLMDLGEAKYTISAIGLYLCFFMAAFAIIMAIIFLATAKSSGGLSSPTANVVDLVSLILGLCGGVVSFFILRSEIGKDSLQSGFYLILTGWVISLVFFIIGKIKKE